MPAALVIARKDLRQRLRDRSAIAIGLVAPLVIAALMSFAFKGTANFHFTLGVVEHDRGPVAADIVRALGQPAARQILTVKTFPTEASAAAAVRAATAQAALVIPAGFSAAAQAAHPISLRVLTSVNSSIAGSITSSIATSFVAQINADRLSVAAALAAGAPSGSLARLEADAAKLTIPEQPGHLAVGANELTAISYYAPAMAIFFLLFMVSFTSRSYFVDRATGMIDRVRAAPVRPVEILIGKALSVLFFGSLSLATIAVITSLAFGAHWGNPLAAAVLGLSMIVAIVCLTALVIVVSRTPRQAEGISSVIVFALALLGGNFVLLSSMPAFMQHLALATPNGWAMRGFTDLATTGGGLATVAQPVSAILIFSAVVGAVASSLAPRAMVR
ncbi:MAG: ABC transporter permease [Acidimicrobiales bacterium]